MLRPSVSIGPAPPRIVARRGCAAQERPHSTTELADRERLRDVVVRAELEPEHLVELVVPGREHDDRHRARGAKPLAHLEAVELRQHQVEDDEVDVLLVEASERLLAVTRGEHPEALPLQRVGRAASESSPRRRRAELLRSRASASGNRVDSQDSTYYSPAMATLPPPAERRRPRPGSLARPVNGRLYRGTWLLVALPLLVTAFTVARPGPLPAPQLPPVFDGATALQLAQDLALAHPDRSPGSPDAREAAAWLRGAARALRPERARGPLGGDDPRPGPRASCVNLIAVSPGRSNQTIVVMAHRDNTGAGPGANDNASGTAALIELARSYATTGSAGTPNAAVGTTNTLVFLSTDGGAFGGLGAARFAGRSPYRNRTVAVVNLDSPRRLDPTADRARRRSAPLPGGGPRQDGGRPRARADRRGARPAAGDRPADRPGLPVQLLRAGSVRRPGDLRDHAHDGRPAARRRRSRTRPTG